MEVVSSQAIKVTFHQCSAAGQIPKWTECVQSECKFKSHATWIGLVLCNLESILLDDGVWGMSSLSSCEFVQ